jgi:hypothetical protein
MMKKLVLLVALLAFVAAVPMMAMGQAPAADKVKCCVKAGDCKDMAKADCEKAKGKVVKDCAECK